MTGSKSHQQTYDAVVIGAGFAGMYMLHVLRQAALTVVAFEAGGDVGGTWYWNRYPGARCDTESLFYSYQFDDGLQQDWNWTERYSAQPEILRYAQHVAHRFDLERDISFNTKIIDARWDERAQLWTVATDTGERNNCRFLISAVGCLSAVNMPDIDGLDEFTGERYQTGLWPHEGVDFRNKTVAIIGTGSSAIQSIPIITEQAEHVTVFQRTPNYVVPAQNRPLDPAEVAKIKADYPAFRAKAKATYSGNIFPIGGPSALDVTTEEREREYENRWHTGGLGLMGAFQDLQLNQASNETAAEFVRSKIRKIVKDPEVARKLSPTNTFGCKRLCVATNYYETYNRDNISLIDLNDTPIKCITANGVRTTKRDYDVDILILATGFDAMTGALNRINIQGTNGQKLTDTWRNGPISYLGLGVNGFPNMFTITGPGSPSVLTNMIPTIEQHVNWIGACLAAMSKKNATRIEATKSAQSEWVAYNAGLADKSLRVTCNSWYLGANVSGKARVFMPFVGGLPMYIEKCEEVVREDYKGFVIT